MAKNDDFVKYDVYEEEIINTIKEKGLMRKKNSDKLTKLMMENEEDHQKPKFSSQNIVNSKKYNETDIFLTNTKDIKDVDKHSDIASHTLISGLKINKVNRFNQ